MRDRDRIGEEALLDRLRAGDERAFGELVDRYHAAFVRIARTFTPSAAMADDAVQEAWIAIAGGIRGFEGRSQLKTWMFRIVVNRAKTRAERDGRTVPFSSLDPADEGLDEGVDPSRFNERGKWQAPPEPWDARTPEELLLREEIGTLLCEALAELPERQRIIVVLRDVEGWSAEEVCSVLELRETNQRVLLHRGRSRLRRLVEARMTRR